MLRALGAGPVAAAGDGLIGVLVAVLLGSLLAVAVAVGLSPLSPLGPVRPVYPDPGIAFDWTVLGVGFAVLGRRPGIGRGRVLLSRRTAPGVTDRVVDGLEGRASPAVPKPRECRWPAWWGCASRSSRVGVAPRCRCARRCWEPSWPSPCWSPPSVSRAVCTPWCRRRRSTGGTGTTCSTRAPTSHPKPSSCSTRPRRRRLERGRLRELADRRPDRTDAGKRQHASCRGTTDPVRTRARRRGPDRAGSSDVGRPAQARRRHGHRELRSPRGRAGLHPADQSADRRLRDVSRGGLLQLHRRPHLDGHRGTGRSPGSSRRHSTGPSSARTRT